MTDYEIGIERAAHEAEWMKRGYAASMVGYAQKAADTVRALPSKPDGTYSGALKDATAAIGKLRDSHANLGPANVYYTFNQIAERINDIPDDPLDEHHCSRRDGILPTTSRGYKETVDGTTTS